MRCRFSAFSTTSPPVRCDSAADVTIGVCLATVAVTIRAARMSSSVTDGPCRPDATARPIRVFAASECFVRVAPARNTRMHETLGWVRAVVVGNRGELDAGFVGNHLRTRGFRFTEAPPRAAGRLAGARRRRPRADARLGVARLRAGDGGPGRGRGGVRPRRRRPRRSRCSGSASAPRCCRTPSAATVSRTADSGDRLVRAGRSSRARRRSPPARGWSGTTTCSPCPRASTSCATTTAGPQLIAGRRAVGTQFHPEATETMVRDWIEHGGAEQYRSPRRRPRRACSPRPAPTRHAAARPPRRSSTGSWSTPTGVASSA